jgi:hypothetical protein
VTNDQRRGLVASLGYARMTVKQAELAEVGEPLLHSECSLPS